MLSLPHLLLVLLIVLLVFGAGKLPRIMGDVGKGVRSLRDGLKGDDETKKIEDKDKDKDNS
jgi:sec-independent protein translocase protein TatA